MPYDRKIAHLEEAHAMLDKELDKAVKQNADDLVISELKKKKLFAKDLIRELRSLDDAGKDFK